ncbi:MAG: ABC transporter ATP-binding protein, partial [Nitrospira sp.]|nr:ABC transporter ATP-binding protein [Nitrospira sp.]
MLNVSDLAVRVEQLSKRYRLGAPHAQDGSLAGALSQGVRRLLGRRPPAPLSPDDTLWALR